jgi:hypothetical protein
MGVIEGESYKFIENGVNAIFEDVDKQSVSLTSTVAVHKVWVCSYYGREQSAE